MYSHKRLLIKYPTRSRPQKAIQTLAKYISFANDIDNIKIIVSLDSDDPSANPESFRRLHPNVEVIVGEPCGKVGAINRDMPDPSTFDILLLASDDMIPVENGYDDIIRDRMEQFYPDTDGVLFFNDGHRGYDLNTLVICGSKYYQRFGYIYYPGYKSLFCDNEFMDEAYRLRKQIYFDMCIIRHEHPSHVGERYDSLYTQNDTYSNHDRALYYSRIQYMYDVSILICTVPSRHYLLSTLLEDIETHKKNVNLKVEVIFDSRTDISVGNKRNSLIARSKGKYSCFVDDDDKITPNYLTVIEDAIKSGIDYDCVALNGRFYHGSRYNGQFYHSIKYSSWTEDRIAYYRPPNHLNPIKTSIYKALPFKDISMQEDVDFAKRLFESGLLKTEYTHDKIQYHYYRINIGTKRVIVNDIAYDMDLKYYNEVFNVKKQQNAIRLRNGRFSLR